MVRLGYNFALLEPPMTGNCIHARTASSSLKFSPRHRHFIRILPHPPKENESPQKCLAKCMRWYPQSPSPYTP
jgi:hypothetical protein